MKYDEIFGSLYQIAGKQASRCALVGRPSEVLYKQQIAEHLGGIANQILPVPTDDDEIILATLFTTEAWEFLQQCENYMVFWTVLQGACINGGRMPNPMPINLYMVRCGHVRWMASTMVIYYQTPPDLPVRAAQ